MEAAYDVLIVTARGKEESVNFDTVILQHIITKSFHTFNETIRVNRVYNPSTQKFCPRLGQHGEEEEYFA